MFKKSHFPNHSRFLRGLLAVCVICSAEAVFAQGRGQLELSVVDADSKEPIAVRMQLRNSRGNLVTVRNATKIGRQFCFDGKIVLNLAVGRYTFQLERGPEYRIRTGDFKILRGANDNKTVTMQRFVDMADEGWYSGDVDLRHRVRQLKIYMMAEDLRLAAVVKPDEKTVSVDTKVQRLGKHRLYAYNVGSDRREIGVVNFCLLRERFEMAPQQLEFPSQFTWVGAARKQLSHIDLATLTHKDLPTWVASQQVSTVGLLNSNVLHEAVEADGPLLGRSADATIYPPPLGTGRWSVTTYYELLNCGFRIAPSAGSGSGFDGNPVGYNRVYVHCGESFSWDAWWSGLRQGRSLITNGPMLRVFVNGELPGHVFSAYDGDVIKLQPSVRLSTREKIAYLQVVKDGTTAAEIRLDEFAKAGGQLPEIEFTESGWMLVRAVTENQKTLRYATSSPFYVEFGGKPRVSRRSCEFFLEWTDKRIAELKRSLPNRLSEKQKESVMRYHNAGRKFWLERRDQANAK